MIAATTPWHSIPHTLAEDGVFYLATGLLGSIAAYATPARAVAAQARFALDGYTDSDFKMDHFGVMTDDDGRPVPVLCPICRVPQADHDDEACRLEYEDDDEAGIAKARLAEPDRFCRFCGADILGNDPCAPGCPAA